MTDERLDAWLGELRTELSAAPSPRMVAGIRARVTAEHRRSPARLATAATIAAIAAGLAATFWFRTSMITPTVERQSAGSILRAPPASPVPSVMPAPAGATSAAARAVSLSRRSQHSPVPTADVASDLPEVLAPPDQGIALRRLLVSLRAGRGFVPAPLAAVGLESLPELEALVVAPLKVEPLDVGSGGGPGGTTP